MEADDDIGNLNARVIDVILDVNRIAAGAQQANESVAENGVAQVPDVRGLVRVDGAMLDEDLFLLGVLRSVDVVLEKGVDGLAALEAGVDVSGSSNFEAIEALDGSDVGDDFFGDLAWSFSEFLRQFEGKRQGIFAEFDLGRLFDDDIRQLNLVLLEQELPDAFD